LNIRLAVNGTLMRGLELNANLLAAGAAFNRDAMTVPRYRLWSIGDRHPAMLRVAHGGAAIAVEVWDVPAAGLAAILLQEPPGLSIGKVRLADGEETLGVLGAGAVRGDARDHRVRRLARLPRPPRRLNRLARSIHERSPGRRTVARGERPREVSLDHAARVRCPCAAGLQPARGVRDHAAAFMKSPR